MKNSLWKIWRIYLLIWIALSTLSFSQYAAAIGKQPPKAVTVVLDDSGSMTDGDRVIPANYALKALDGLLGDEDTLTIYLLNHDKPLGPYTGAFGFEEAIKKLNNFKNNDGGTPYGIIPVALEQLVKRPEAEKWFVVITDGSFTGYNPNADSLIRQLVNQHKVHAAFILIQQIDSTVANLWKQDTAAEIFSADSVKDIPDTLIKVGTWLNGLSNKGVSIRESGRSVYLDLDFPLRKLILLHRDIQNAELIDAKLANNNKADTSRKHLIHANDNRKSLKDARVYHIKSADGSVIEAGKNAIQLNFAKETSGLDITAFPDVAANFSLMLTDTNGHPLKPDASGTYSVCGSHYRASAQLVDDKGRSLLKGRTDLSSFAFEVNVGGKKSKLIEEKNTFVVDLQSGVANTEISMTGSAQYPGYFHKISTPIKVRFNECKRDIALEIESGAEKTGDWQSYIDHLENTSPVKLKVTINGNPASEKEMAQWDFGFGTHAEMLQTTFQKGYMLIKPKSICCLEWWKEIGPGVYQVPINISTGNSYDVIKAPKQLSFAISPPMTIWDKLRWYGCPFFVLMIVSALFWYLKRIITKSRFGSEARLTIVDEDIQTGTKRPSTVFLSEQCSALKRWLWPSKGEVVELFGIHFTADGEDLVLDGRDLQSKHTIQGWYYDKSRDEAMSKKERQQNDAQLSDNSQMTIEEGRFKKRIIYHFI